MPRATTSTTFAGSSFDRRWCPVRDSSLLRILGSDGQDAVLTGKAGCGKTGCVIEFVEALRAADIPVLAFRLDRIEPVSSADELGRKLGLEASPTLVLAAAAGERQAVLVIDQLDAIGTVSGRATGFLDAVEGILIESRGLRERSKLHVVVVCREFDWKNDHRLKGLLATGHLSVSVGEFSSKEVKNLLSAAAFDSALFHKRQIHLLGLPQNLSL